MRVLILSSWYPNALNPVKGVFVREQVRALAQSGLDVTVVYPFDDALSVGEERYAEEEGIPTWRANSLAGRSGSPAGRGTSTALGGRRFARIRSYRYSLSLLKRVTEEFRPDILHVHVGYPAAIIAYFFARKHSLPYVITEHMSFLRDYVAKWQHRLLLKPAFEKAALVMPVSPALSRQLESFGWHLVLRPLPNVVDTGRFTPDGVSEKVSKEVSEELSQKLSPQASEDGSAKVRGDGVLRILFVGGMDETEVKGLQFLLPALAGFVREFPARLEIVGDGPLRRHYETLARDLGIEGSCQFRGTVAPEKMPGCYRRSDFLVLSSLKETFGCVLTEALASGIPVLATACGGPESIVTAETGLLVQPGSSAALLTGLREMAGKVARYDPQTLRAYAEQHFGPQALAEELKEVYQAVCQEARKEARP